jgi:hypothetical protein
MELQEIVLHGVTVQVRFVPRPRYGDARGKLVEDLAEAFDLTEWTLGPEVLVTTRDRSRSYLVGSSELRAQREAVPDERDAESEIGHFIEYCANELNVAEATFLGVRTFWLGAVDSFEDLTAWMVGRFGGGAAELVSEIGKPVTDVGWSFEMHGDDPKWSLRLGPMTADQLISYTLFSEQSRERLPADSLFLDLDRVFNDRPLPRDSLVQTFASSLQKNLEMGRHLASLLGEDGSLR